jgi:hypothetical protein
MINRNELIVAMARRIFGYKYIYHGSPPRRNTCQERLGWLNERQ